MRPAIRHIAAAAAALALGASARADVDPPAGAPAPAPTPAPAPWYEHEREREHEREGPPPPDARPDGDGGAAAAVVEDEAGASADWRGGPRDPRVGIEAAALFTRLRDRFEYEQGGLGEMLRVHSELPIDPYQAGFEVGAWARLDADWAVDTRWTRVEYGDDGLAGGDGFTHAGAAFAADREVETRVEVHAASFGAEYGFELGAPAERGHLRLGFPFGVVWVSERLRVRDEQTRERASGTIVRASPYLGLHLDIYHRSGIGFEAELRCGGWFADLEERCGYVDARVQGYFAAGENLRIFAGIRLLGFDYKEDHNDDRAMKLAIDGVYVGIGAHW